METIHTGAAAITFPTTPEAFIAYQEQLAGRKLTEHEREVTAAWVEVFNLSYEGGLEQDRAALEDSLANARVIDESKIDKSKVQILSKVTLLNHNTKKEMVYTIVAEHEANLREGKLAIGTPIAKALLGHKKGDRVDVEVPAGTIHFEILDISI